MNNTRSVAEPPAEVRQISVSELARLGVSQLAYVKPVMVDGNPAFAIHAADGTPMAVTTDQETALVAIHQHDMAAVLVH
ncbi:MAG: DUF1150 family protein [Acidisphaera sp.]|nr:DUF1150 family protein [Acidisphaera sp.]